MSGTPDNVIIGPGWLYMAPLATSEPADSTTALPSAWISLGYTEDGTDMVVSNKNDQIMVAETKYPIRVVNSESVVKLRVKLAEPTLRNLKAAFGGGTAGSNTATSMELPTDLTGIMLVHDSHPSTSLTENRRKVFRECYPSSDVSVAFKKSPNKTTVDVEFMAVLPENQTSPAIFLKPAGVSVAV